MNSGFDNLLRLKPGVAETLIALNGLLRPLIRREWIHQIQQINDMEETDLETVLFDRDREFLTPVRENLSELQGGRCFFCQSKLPAKRHVDHFIPWARYPNNAVENLVVAHESCNLKKRDFLAAAEHVERWTAHVSRHKDDLVRIGAETPLGSERSRTLGIAAATYLRLPDSARVWLMGDELVEVERQRIEEALRAA